MAEINLPVIGKTKSGFVWAGVAITAAIVGYAYIKHRSSSSSTASTAADSSSASIDPQTGYPYGSAEDQAALAASQGYGSGGANGFYGDGYGYGYGGIPGYPAPTSANPNSGPGTFTANAYWLSWCESNIQGYNATAIQNALVAGLDGGKLNATDWAIWEAANAIGGPPPQPPNPAPTQQGGGGSGSGGGGGGGGGGTVSGQVKGLHFTNMGVTSAALLWEAVTGSSGYTVTVLEHGTLIEKETVSSPAATVTGLKSKTNYSFEVSAQPGSGHTTITGVTH